MNGLRESAQWQHKRSQKSEVRVGKVSFLLSFFLSVILVETSLVAPPPSLTATLNPGPGQHRQTRLSARLDKRKLAATRQAVMHFLVLPGGSVGRQTVAVTTAGAKQKTSSRGRGRRKLISFVPHLPQNGRNPSVRRQQQQQQQQLERRKIPEGKQTDEPRHPPLGANQPKLTRATLSFPQTRARNKQTPGGAR